MVANIEKHEADWLRSMKLVQQVDKFPTSEWLAALGLTQDSPIADFADRLIWGTYGRPARIPEQWKRLRDLDTEHLENILITQRQIPLIYSRAIMVILRERHTDSEN